LLLSGWDYGSSGFLPSLRDRKRAGAAAGFGGSGRPRDSRLRGSVCVLAETDSDAGAADFAVSED